MLSLFGKAIAVPRWTTAQFGTNFLPACSITLCCPFTAGAITFST